MSFNNSIESITEGKTKIFVFKNKFSGKGPGSRDKLPFYNPAMEINRDLSILINQWFINNNSFKVHILDGLAASGIRGIRFANEIDGDFFITINDWSENAYDLIKKNLDVHKFSNVIGVNRNLNVLLSEERFHYIDIDPFGSPVYYIDSAIRSIHNKGIIACTATDSATLCGVYPKVCLRRYGISSFHSPIMHEIGLRILLSFICREAAKYDKGIEPIVCYYYNYYFRVYFRVINGVDYANKSINNLKLININSLYSNDKYHEIGPIWLGKTQNKRVICELRTILSKKLLNTKNYLWKFLDLLENESDAPAFFYASDYIASKLKISPPKMEYIFKKLEGIGYDVYKTHFCNTGFKTNAPFEEIKKIFYSYSK
jgi:tRNA (guanine26-N2/guanine27-N2)-dimethyltransferase